MLGRTLTISGLVFIGLVNFGPHFQKTTAYKAPQQVSKLSPEQTTTPKPAIVPVTPVQPTVVPAPQTPVKKLYSTGVEQWRPLVQEYFGAETNYALAVMMCESGGNAANHNYNPATGDDSWGLYQINRFGSLGNGRPSGAWLSVPENNISYAAKMQHAQGWTPWSCSKKL